MEKYKVVKIIDNESLVINAGETNQIKVGDEFRIVNSNGEKITDPDTGESLGTLDEIKGTVTAVVIYPHLTVAKAPYETQFDYGLEPDRLPLNVDPAQITGGYSTDNPSPIQIGDIAQLIK
ncbi:hypothetical protein [Lacticaseibacillus paracasei]|uniref:hypothetical protein n=1 Tax=Lacticaseibacillus paracasei TaxID=1597 RepID=UPI0015FD3FDD|nr:hypothetical protein [Lacticaseibacillus paracasei]MBB1166691.1 hypothetical protein [Lacticaseibacillus paracasei]